VSEAVTVEHGKLIAIACEERTLGCFSLGLDGFALETAPPFAVGSIVVAELSLELGQVVFL
jgi:hypothetical protein